MRKLLSSAASPFVLQGLLRASALSLPLLIIICMRQVAPVELELSFFSLITDVTLLVAFAKIGVDVYLPGCRSEGGVVAVSEKYQVAYSAIIVLSLVTAIYGMARGGSWPMAMVTCFVLCSLALAEAGRLDGRFSLFYFLKAPSVYIGSLLASIVFINELWWAAWMAIVLMLVFIYKVKSVFRRGEEENDIDYRSLAMGAIVSLFVVIFSWKEAAVSRYFFDGSSLAELVTYSRLALVVTFPFMLRNARVPLVLRTHDDPRSASAIRMAVRAGRRVNIIWSCIAAVAIVCVVLLVENDAAPGVALLMGGTCVLVAFGNVGACLIFLRDYRGLILAHSTALVTFLACLLLLGMTGVNDVFFAVSLASFVAQVALSWQLLRFLKIRSRETVPPADQYASGEM